MIARTVPLEFPLTVPGGQISSVAVLPHCSAAGTEDVGRAICLASDLVLDLDQSDFERIEEAHRDATAELDALPPPDRAIYRHGLSRVILTCIKGDKE